MFCKVKGGNSLEGEVDIYGAKNEVLKILVASCITSGDVILNNIPLIEDVYEKIHLLKCMNVEINYINQRSVYINSRHMVPDCSLRYTRIRTSITLMGLLLGRFGKFVIPIPHGDNIGTRKIDMHLDALTQMGANILIKDNQIHGWLETPTLQAIEYTLKFQSMGATENIILAAIFANGTTILNNASIEPEVKNLCNFISQFGISIEGIGTSRLVIHGSSRIIDQNLEYDVQSDRMQIMTYMLLPLVVPDSKVAINYHGSANFFGDFLTVVLNMGLKISLEDNRMVCSRSYHNKFKDYTLSTGVFPLFHTDILPPVVAAFCLNGANSLIKDYIYSNRFKGYIEELNKLDAKIVPINPNEIKIDCIDQFQQSDSTLYINDIRCGPTLLLAALNCNGTTKINNLQQCDRGYENIIHNLQMMGADISVGYENSL